MVAKNVNSRVSDARELETKIGTMSAHEDDAKFHLHIVSIPSSSYKIVFYDATTELQEANAKSQDENCTV